MIDSSIQGISHVNFQGEIGFNKINRSILDYKDLKLKYANTQNSNWKQQLSATLNLAHSLMQKLVPLMNLLNFTIKYCIKSESYFFLNLIQVKYSSILEKFLNYYSFMPHDKIPFEEDFEATLNRFNEILKEESN